MKALTNLAKINDISINNQIKNAKKKVIIDKDSNNKKNKTLTQ